MKKLARRLEKIEARAGKRRRFAGPVIIRYNLKGEIIGYRYDGKDYKDAADIPGGPHVFLPDRTDGC
jgi:hypothetical protein